MSFSTKLNLRTVIEKKTFKIKTKAKYLKKKDIKIVTLH